MAQAASPRAAARTRPFVVDLQRLHEQFPEEQARSERQLVDQVASLLPSGRTDHARFVYTLVFGELERRLRDRERPRAAEVTALVGFVLAAVGLS